MIHEDTLVIGLNEQKVEYQMALCCLPEPGEEVFGFVTINDGIKIHSIKCPNSITLFENYGYRVIKARWRKEDSVQQKGHCHIFEYIDPSIYREIINNPSLLHELNSRKFELLLADILESFQYEIELTKQTRDGGIDIIAIKKQGHFGPEKYLLEAKRWKSKVGIQPVRTLAFLHDHYKATKSCLATTSKFTNDAWKLHKELKYKLDLKEGQDILDWIKEANNQK